MYYPTLMYVNNTNSLRENDIGSRMGSHPDLFDWKKNKLGQGQIGEGWWEQDLTWRQQLG